MVRSLAALALIVLSGCVTYPKLQPVDPGQILGDRPLAARVAQANVQVVVQSDQWRGDPEGLADYLTPLLVIVENGGQRPIRLRYQEFALVGQSGFRYAAIPPLNTDRTSEWRGPNGLTFQTAGWRGGWRGARPVFRPRFGMSRFFIAPNWAPFYPGLGVWGGPFAWNPWYYGNAYAYWSEPLPTRDMLERAMPEGVLQPEGRISGFVYFPALKREEGVTFELDLVDAESGEVLGKAAIPFRVIL